MAFFDQMYHAGTYTTYFVIVNLRGWFVVLHILSNFNYYTADTAINDEKQLLLSILSG